MSSLQLQARPWTVFDPDNMDHRRYYYEYIKTNTWGKCPVRFVLPERKGDLVSMIRRSLIDWYVIHEFEKIKGKVIPITRHKGGMRKKKLMTDRTLP